ncbi:TPA: hypothetical protein ACYZYV_002228 [Escherichia coli]
MAIVHRLQQIMVNENLTPDELVGCAEIVRDNYGRFNYIGQSRVAPPPRRRLENAASRETCFQAGGVEQRAK